MRGLQVWSEGRKRRVGAGLKGLPWVARGGKHGKGAAAAAEWWAYSGPTHDMMMMMMMILLKPNF